jgi:hypothetical protein
MDDKLLDPELLSEAWNQLHPSHRELFERPITWDGRRAKSLPI